MNLFDLRCNASHRRAHHGVIEIALCLVKRRLGLCIGRELIDRQIGIAEQLGFCVRNLLLEIFELRFRRDKGVRRIVEIELRAEIALDERALALDVALLQIDSLLRKIFHLLVDPDVGHQIVIGGAGLVEGCLGLLHGEAERHRIDFEQHVAFADPLAFAHHDLFDLAGNVRRDQNFLRPDIGIVGGHVAAAIEI
ncbi:hypothetical protein GALL_421900 [mine drainage metagenome]|uniref:Uncharacterized protein n=1 Tax=mine drainage metagenome TaxID=410659 RepID=A0A1J5QJE6_9ZZZZ